MSKHDVMMISLSLLDDLGEEHFQKTRSINLTGLLSSIEPESHASLVWVNRMLC